MYYAAINGYASDSDVGFANTWGILAFETRTARDDYVNQAPDLATRAIKRAEISRYIGSPKPFSGQRYMLGVPARDIPGVRGEVYLGSEYDAQAIQPLNQ